MRLFYSLALYGLSPLFFTYLLVRGWQDRAYWQRWPERLGYCRDKVVAGGIVVHAVSVGEVNAAAGLVRQLQKKWPGEPVTLTCFTSTGSRRIRELFNDTVSHVYWPWDLPGAVNRFLDTTQPRLIIILETEIWPNLYAAAKQRNIPLMLVNARISDRSLSRYRRLGSLTRSSLAAVDQVSAQSAEDLRRLVSLGAAPENSHLGGNLKYELQLPDNLPAKAAQLRRSWGEDRPVWLAASTREGEEALVMEAFGGVLSSFPDALLVVVPRHPERFAEVQKLLEDSGLPWAKHSVPGNHFEKVSVLLVDAMGELMNYYAACDLAFVGGSLVPTGGHNVLEAAALAKPVLVGPHTFNFAEITDKLIAAGAARRVPDVASLQGEVLKLLGNPDQRREMGSAGLRIMTMEQGAMNRTLDLVDKLLADPEITPATG